MKKNFKRRDFIKKAGVAAAAATAVSSFPAPAIAADRIEVNCVATWGRGYPGLGTGGEAVSQRISDLSDGRIIVNHYAGGERVGPLDVFTEVSSGNAQMYNSADYYWVGQHPGWGFFAAVPFGLISTEINGWIRHGGGQELWDELADGFGLKNFMAGNSGVQMGGWFNKEIITMDDLKGLKIRMPGLGGEVLRRVGSAAVAIPGGEIYPALQSGAIDATEWVGPWNDLAFAFYQVAKFYYWPGFHEPGAGLATGVNLDTWNSLTNTQREIFKNVFSHENTYTLAEFNHHNSIALNTLINKHDVQMRSFSKEIMNELKLKSSEVLEDVATKDPISNEIYLSFMDNLKRLRNWSKHSELAYMASRED